METKIIAPSKVTVYDYTNNTILAPPDTALIQRPDFDDGDEPSPGIVLTAVTFALPKDAENSEQKVEFILPQGQDLYVRGSGLLNLYSIKDDKSPETWLDEPARTWLGTWQVNSSVEGGFADLAHTPDDPAKAANNWVECQAAGKEVTFLLEGLVDGDMVRWKYQNGGVVLVLRGKDADA